MLMEKSKNHIWQILFWTETVIAVLAGWFLFNRSKPGTPEEQPVNNEIVMMEPEMSRTQESPKPVNHYALKGSVAANSFTEYIPSSEFRMEEDATGVTFYSTDGRQLLRCDVLEHLEAHWPDPDDPALLRYRTVYEDWNYRAVFEYVEEWADAAGKTTFKVGPVALFKSTR